MPTKRSTKVYKVMNPHNIPPEIPVIGPWESGGQTYTWHEGDDLEPPDGMSLVRLLRDGFIVEVK